MHTYFIIIIIIIINCSSLSSSLEIEKNMIYRIDYGVVIGLRGVQFGL